MVQVSKLYRSDIIQSIKTRSAAEWGNQLVDLVVAADKLRRSKIIIGCLMVQVSKLHRSDIIQSIQTNIDHHNQR